MCQDSRVRLTELKRGVALSVLTTPLVACVFYVGPGACVRLGRLVCVCVCVFFFFLSVCLRASHCPDSNALSAGFLPAHHGLHIGCQCESDSLSYALRCANFSTWPCHARFPLVCSLSLHLLPLPLSLSLHLCSLDVDHLPSLFVNLNFAS